MAHDNKLTEFAIARALPSSKASVRSPSSRREVALFPLAAPVGTYRSEIKKSQRGHEGEREERRPSRWQTRYNARASGDARRWRRGESVSSLLMHSRQIKSPGRGRGLNVPLVGPLRGVYGALNRVGITGRGMITRVHVRRASPRSGRLSLTRVKG